MDQSHKPSGIAIEPASVKYVDFASQFMEERELLHAIVDEIFSTGQFIAGEWVEKLETELAAFCETHYAVAVNSGTDALILAMKAVGIGPGDEVITPPNSFVASAAAVVAVGATPVFCDCLDDQNIDPAAAAAAITPRTAAIMPVHLTGRMADMATIMDLAMRHGLWVIEDAAQAIGTRYDDMVAGSAGHIGCFSTHPLKNLNAAGDGGFITTNDRAVDAFIRLHRNHGMIDRETVVTWGGVSRMDSLQAAILSDRLQRLSRVTTRRRRNAAQYRQQLNADIVFQPPETSRQFNTYHTFVVQLPKRDDLKYYLEDHDIATAVHYPIPIHLQPAAEHLGYQRGDFPVVEAQADRIISLPVHQYLEAGDIQHVAGMINRFYDSHG